MKDIALITGCYGQDGSYLAELLTKKGYEVHGICRERLSENSSRIRKELGLKNVKVVEHYESIYDYTSIKNLIGRLKPAILFHTAARHYSSEKRENSELYTNKILYDDNVLATGNILCGCKKASDKTHVMISGSCLMYDNSGSDRQSENMPYMSRSMYGTAKIAEAGLAQYYRNEGLFVSVAILYNHESHRRSKSFVTQKIANGLMEIKEGKRERLVLADLGTKKDWGFAGDYVRGMYLMLMAEKPGDYIFSSGNLHTIRDYVEECARQLSLDDWEKYVICDGTIVTRKIHGELFGDNEKAVRNLGWRQEYGFSDLVNDMITGGRQL